MKFVKICREQNVKNKIFFKLLFLNTDLSCLLDQFQETFPIIQNPAKCSSSGKRDSELRCSSVIINQFSREK